jgi:uncharacterized membrane protein
VVLPLFFQPVMPKTFFARMGRYRSSFCAVMRQAAGEPAEGGSVMDDLAVARALHVLAIVVWIGGVAMVTSVILPAVRRMAKPNERIAFFESVERRFAFQARVSTVLAAVTGFYMVYRLELWDRFLDVQYWWMHAMVAVWAVFTLVLFVLEPLVLHRLFNERAQRDPEGTFRLVERLHWVLLTLSLVTTFGAVAGVHGAFFL